MLFFTLQCSLWVRTDLSWYLTHLEMILFIRTPPGPTDLHVRDGMKMNAPGLRASFHMTALSTLVRSKLALYVKSYVER